MDGFKTLKNDIKIYERMCNDSKYLIELQKLEEIILALKITTEALYYRYQMVLPQLEKFTYYEATIFERLKKTEYLEFIKSKVNSQQINKKMG